MSAGVTSERVYDALKARLASGAIMPGERLEPGMHADLLASSVTPVRDALHRLAGERIVEMRAAEGFQFPLVTEPGLRALLWWNAELLRLALRRWPMKDAGVTREIVVSGHEAAVRAVFAAVAARSGHLELIAQVDAASDRLATARVAESRAVPGSREELAGLVEVIASGDPRAIARRISAYHRRLASLAPTIVEAMYRRAEHPDG